MDQRTFGWVQRSLKLNSPVADLKIQVKYLPSKCGAKKVFALIHKKQYQDTINLFLISENKYTSTN